MTSLGVCHLRHLFEMFHATYTPEAMSELQFPGRAGKAEVGGCVRARPCLQCCERYRQGLGDGAEQAVLHQS